MGLSGLRDGLELDTPGELRGATRIGLGAGDLAKAGVAEHCTGNGELCVIGDVIQIRLKTQPGGFSEVKGEAATKADVEIVVAWTIDVVRSGARRVAKDKVWGGNE